MQVDRAQLGALLKKSWKVLAAVVSLAAGLVGIANYLGAHHAKPPEQPPAAIASVPVGVEISGSDNGAGGVFFDHSSLRSHGPLRIRAGNGGPNGPGGNVVFKESPVEGIPSASQGP